MKETSSFFLLIFLRLAVSQMAIISVRSRFLQASVWVLVISFIMPVMAGFFFIRIIESVVIPAIAEFGIAGMTAVSGPAKGSSVSVRSVMIRMISVIFHISFLHNQIMLGSKEIYPSLSMM